MKTLYAITAAGGNMKSFTLHYELTQAELAAYVLKLFNLGYTGIIWQEIASCNPV